MKLEKGITLTSLMIYIVAMLATVSIITVVTGYFYSNIDITNDEYSHLAEFSRLESYFLKEANKKGNTILIEPEQLGQIPIIFECNGQFTQYTYVQSSKSIYQNKIKIASYVENCTFSKEQLNGKQVLTVKLTIKDKTRTLKYTFVN